MVIGTAGPLPEAPKEQVQFLEDLTDADLALATKTPAGLVNLGNTCYANASIQALRAIPELGEALEKYQPGAGVPGRGDAGLTRAMKGLWAGMKQTAEGFPPMMFLQVSGEKWGWRTRRAASRNVTR